MEQCQVDILRVMVAVDFSRYSEITFLHALTLARALKAELILVNVINSRHLETVDRLASLGYEVSSERYVEAMKDERLKTLEEEYLPAAKDVKARVVFKVGLPWEEIVKAAREENANLLVIGAKGRTDLERVLFGHAGEKVFRHAHCPVVSVRGPEHCRLPA